MTTDLEKFANLCDTEFFHKNKLSGDVCKGVVSMNPFIRINDLDAFVKWVAEITGINYPNVRVKLNEIVYATVEKTRKLLLNNFLNNKVIINSFNGKYCQKYYGMLNWPGKNAPRLKDALLSSFYGLQWSFPLPASENIFVDPLPVQELACRAGVLEPRKKIIYLHNLNDKYNVRKPTVFDAGFYVQFDPGGKTKPLSACSHLTGFDEYVHKPNHFYNLQDRFHEIF
jgi:hypothetical protein